MSQPARARAIICYSGGCPKHEPPDGDCIECAKAFWGAVLARPGDDHYEDRVTTVP